MSFAYSQVDLGDNKNIFYATKRYDQGFTVSNHSVYQALGQ
ncbi:Uncharacterised protein [Yersinia enterocolitica]|nr:Uncharacterised protein [Yersinia enterocolitica]